MPVTLSKAASAAFTVALVFIPGPSGPMLHALLCCGDQGHSPFIGRDGTSEARETAAQARVLGSLAGRMDAASRAALSAVKV